MGRSVLRSLFDRRDHELLAIVNEVRHRDRSQRHAKLVFYPYLHPQGIKEIAESKGLRIAHAVIRLLDSLEGGEADERLSALRSLRDEILSAASGSLPRNTARVLLQIMKELARAQGDHERQLELARDFRMTAAGKPRQVRRQLRQYHLLEMPEAWNQLAFDDHVHDANTKGRKSSTHLIMDAWIKGIRRLRVIYYNYLEPRFAAELIAAAEIMGITLRIGVEFSTRFRDRYTQLIWVPRGFPDAQAFLCFLAEEPVAAFMAAGRKVSRYQQRYVYAALAAYNARHRREIGRRWEIDPPPAEVDAFTAFVGTGQASLLHLGEFLHLQLQPLLRQAADLLKGEYRGADDDRRQQIAEKIAAMNALDAESLVETFLKPEANPEIPDPAIPREEEGLPALLRLTPHQLLSHLHGLHSGYRITLNLSNLQVQDVLEILYDTEGLITRLEIFNLKDHALGRAGHIPAINALQQAINSGNAVAIKRKILDIIERVTLSDVSDKTSRIEKLTTILHDIPSLRAMYGSTPLKGRIGSDSTGRSSRLHGMGLAVLETLTPRARREIRQARSATREVIPFQMTVHPRLTFVAPAPGHGGGRTLLETLGRIPFLGRLGMERRRDWVFEEFSTRMAQPGNIITLGGIQKGGGNDLSLADATPPQSEYRVKWRYLKSGLKNALKVIIGFVPAFATFSLTKDWWLLAYGGAFIWFGITGLRNILQAVLGGGGISRSPLLHWNDYVSWERITDSLLFTGFSVPLLDYLVKTLALDRGMGINAASDPVSLYALMALSNGIYLASHNTFRGFSRGVILGNFFRSVLSIPIAIALNAGLATALGAAGVVAAAMELQKWAAVISKTASDLVAGLIEGTADRYANIRARMRGYQNKFSQLFDAYAELELLHPDMRVMELLEEPEKLSRSQNAEARDLLKIVIINALDLLYFWMYQPRARSALKTLLAGLSAEERLILLQSQRVLRQFKEISQLFVDGIVGKNFSRALSFYLNHYEAYLAAMEEMIREEE